MRDDDDEYQRHRKENERVMNRMRCPDKEKRNMKKALFHGLILITH